MLTLCMIGYANAQETIEAPASPEAPAASEIPEVPAAPEGAETPARAEEPAAPEAPASPEEEKADPRGTKVSKGNSDLDGLNLSEEQEAHISDIKDFHSESLMKLRKSSGQSNSAEFRQALKDMAAKQDKEIREVLSEEQIKAYDKILEARKGSKAKAVKTSGEVID